MRRAIIGWLATALLSIPISVNAQSCTVNAPTNGTHGNCPASLPSGDSCQFSCNSGYLLEGSETSCTNGVLTAQTCMSSSCVVSAPQNGNYGSCSSSIASGNSCSIVCNAGYSVLGSETSCSAGVLTATQSCVPTPCSVPAPANGNFGTCSSPLSSGSTCQYSCNSGYALAGTATSCSFGTLTAQTCVPQSCTLTSPVNGTLGTCSSSLASGSTCQVSCNSGYSVTGTATSCSYGQLTEQTCAMTPPTDGGTTDGPLPLWAIGALGVCLIGIASRRLKKAA
jgi:hypothetical protein